MPTRLHHGSRNRRRCLRDFTRSSASDCSSTSYMRSASAHASKTLCSVTVWRCLTWSVVSHSRGTRLIAAFDTKLETPLPMSPRPLSRRVSRRCARAVPCFNYFPSDRIRGNQVAFGNGIQHTIYSIHHTEDQTQRMHGENVDTLLCWLCRETSVLAWQVGR